MASTFPASVQTFSDPIATDTLSGHAALHTDVNDTLEAVQNKLGVDNDSDTSTIDYRVRTLESEITPSGVVSMFAGATAPTGWLLCNGAAVSRTTYADLFAVVGSTYGAGNGSTTFNVPDFRDRVPVGAGSSYSLGQAIGALVDTITLSSANLPTHTHGLNNHTHTTDPDSASFTSGGPVGSNEYVVERNATYIDPTGPSISFRIPDAYYHSFAGGMQVKASDWSHSHSTTVDLAGKTSGGPSTANTTDGGFANSAFNVDIVQPSRGINFIIKA